MQFDNILAACSLMQTIYVLCNQLEGWYMLFYLDKGQMTHVWLSLQGLFTPLSRSLRRNSKFGLLTTNQPAKALCHLAIVKTITMILEVWRFTDSLSRDVDSIACKAREN